MPSNPVECQTELLGRVKIYDLGNIPVNQGQSSEHKDLYRDQAQLILASTVHALLTKVPKSRIFIIGGSDEMNRSLLKAVNTCDDLTELKALHLDSALDVKPLHKRQIDEQAPTHHETN